MRLKLFLSVLFFCAITKAQTNTELKDFINKNNGAIRTVQKSMIRETNNAYISTFKELVKNQEAAVKAYNIDIKASCYFAFLVRTECVNFFDKHSQGDLSKYFEFTINEKTFLKSSNEDRSKQLTSDDIKTIEGMDAMSPQSLNKLILTIQ